ncbi:MAG: hypothetical protein OXQ32_04400 [bacterium]|nr:hypothetical protein [bacterium]
MPHSLFRWLSSSLHYHHHDPWTHHHDPWTRHHYPRNDDDSQWCEQPAVQAGAASSCQSQLLSQHEHHPWNDYDAACDYYDPACDYYYAACDDYDSSGSSLFNW